MVIISEMDTATRIQVLFSFCIALMPFGKVLIQIFSIQLLVNSRADVALEPYGNWSRRKTPGFQPVKLLKNWPSAIFLYIESLSNPNYSCCPRTSWYILTPEVYLAQCLSLQKMELVTHVQCLDKAVCISLYVNVLRKGTNPSIPLLLWVNKVSLKKMNLLLIVFLLLKRCTFVWHLSL